MLFLLVVSEVIVELVGVNKFLVGLVIILLFVVVVLFINGFMLLFLVIVWRVIEVGVVMLNIWLLLVWVVIKIGVKCKFCVRLVSFILSLVVWFVRLVIVYVVNKVKGKVFMIDFCFWWFKISIE